MKQDAKKIQQVLEIKKEELEEEQRTYYEQYDTMAVKKFEGGLQKTKSHQQASKPLQLDQSFNIRQFEVLKKLLDDNTNILVNIRQKEIELITKQANDQLKEVRSKQKEMKSQFKEAFM